MQIKVKPNTCFIRLEMCLSPAEIARTLARYLMTLSIVLAKAKLPLSHSSHVGMTLACFASMQYQVNFRNALNTSK